MIDLRGAWRWVAAYARSDDPLAGASNTIALVIVGNQPFYPLYVQWFVGDDRWLSCLTFLSTPFFMAVPALTRRWPASGRALLPLAGIGNTIFCAKIFGDASGVELFLAPCVCIAALTFRWRERWWMLGVIAIAWTAFAGLHGRLGDPMGVFSATQYASFLSMNAISVACLTALVGYRFASARGEIERARDQAATFGASHDATA